ncbi:hypothetical protein NC797_06985 [Aquibacillus sp. 3ASR75-11]|uniref:Uncharacterized protein n=1 Tax=Terrihalobacillus insolitus TaxID=2950438 RepID=A0A9X4ALD1_9BACI|nr:hypothetical protein [Terrihalobacillus insolitus]MDC3424252.1 hypothetical protein [Terrihalobacillus insolitus]
MNRSQEKYEKALEEKDKLMNANYELKITLERERSDGEKKESVIALKESKIAELKKKSKK